VRSAGENRLHDRLAFRFAHGRRSTCFGHAFSITRIFGRLQMEGVVRPRLQITRPGARGGGGAGSSAARLALRQDRRSLSIRDSCIEARAVVGSHAGSAG
jgi:hypothetical protein